MLFHGNPPLFGCVFQHVRSAALSLSRLRRLDTFSRLGEGFHSCALLSCLAVLAKYRSQLRLISTQQMPAGQQTAQLDARAGEARPRGKYSRERMALAPIRARRIFPAPRVASDPFQFLSN